MKKQIEGQTRGREEVKLKIEEIEEKVLRRERYLKVGGSDSTVSVGNENVDDDNYVGDDRKKGGDRVNKDYNNTRLTNMTTTRLLEIREESQLLMI